MLKYLLPSYRRAEERDLEEELQSLRAMAEPHELGNLTRAAENARAVWGWNWLENSAQDLRYGFRTLLRNRRVTAIALLSLGLGHWSKHTRLQFRQDAAFPCSALSGTGSAGAGIVHETE